MKKLIGIILVSTISFICRLLPNLDLSYSVIINNKGAFSNLVRSGYYNSKFRKIGYGTRIEEKIDIHTFKKIIIGENCLIEKHSKLVGGRKLNLGDSVVIKTGSIIKSGDLEKSKIVIGDRTNINEYCYLDGVGGLLIGNDVLVAPQCSINSSGHEFKNPDMKIIDQSRRLSTVIIEDDVWIGANSTIVPGVKIGKGAVVGAGSVVTKDLPPYSISMGVPAKVTDFRKKD